MQLRPLRPLPHWPACPGGLGEYVSDDVAAISEWYASAAASDLVPAISVDDEDDAELAGACLGAADCACDGVWVAGDDGGCDVGYGDALPYSYVDADEWPGACASGGEDEVANVTSCCPDDSSVLAACSAVG